MFHVKVTCSGFGFGLYADIPSCFPFLFSFSLHSPSIGLYSPFQIGGFITFHALFLDWLSKRAHVQISSQEPKQNSWSLKEGIGMPTDSMTRGKKSDSKLAKVSRGSKGAKIGQNWTQRSRKFEMYKIDPIANQSQDKLAARNSKSAQHIQRIINNSKFSNERLFDIEQVDRQIDY